MSEELRTGLWNAVHNQLFQPWLYNARMGGAQIADHPLIEFSKSIAGEVLKIPVDGLSLTWVNRVKPIREYFMTAPWFRVYEFLEFAATHVPVEARAKVPLFTAECNRVLEREMSGYRFVSAQLVRITDSKELQAIEDARRQTGRLDVVQRHLDTAMKHLSDRDAPDYRNSIKESISAVESFCSLLAGQSKADLDAALRTLESKLELHPALKRSFKALYGYSSDANGIRHALLEESNLTFDDAKFMLVSCSAFINYLKAQAARANVQLT